MRVGLYFLMSITVLLTGCDKAAEKMAELFPTKSLTITIPSGYEVTVAGKNAKIFGQGACPGEDLSMQRYDCVVITPITKDVQVNVLADGKLIEEKWTVERYGQSEIIFFRTQNGLLVNVAKIKGDI